MHKSKRMYAMSLVEHCEIQDTKQWGPTTFTVTVGNKKGAPVTAPSNKGHRKG